MAQMVAHAIPMIFKGYVKDTRQLLTKHGYLNVCVKDTRTPVYRMRITGIGINL